MDVDIVVAGGLSELRAAQPAGTINGRNAWQLGLVELWESPLRFTVEGRWYDVHLDRPMRARIVSRRVLGLEVPVMPVEDVMVCKAIRQQKHDVEDIRAMWATVARQLDLAYLDWRARQCGANGRVVACMRALGRDGADAKR
jgi:hypothetical protein